MAHGQLLHSHHRILQLSYALPHPPRHLIGQELIVAFYDGFVGFLELRELFAGGFAVVLGVDRLLLRFFGGDFELVACGCIAFFFRLVSFL